MRIRVSWSAGLTLVACVVVVGCSKKDTGAAMDTSAAASMTTNPTGATTAAGSTVTNATAGAAAATANPAPAGEMSDANIMALLDEANSADSADAATALPNLTSTGARNFAKLMMGEHHALHVQGVQLEKAQNITPQLPTPDPFKPAVEGEMSALSSAAKGAAYDSTYIANEVAIHQAVIDWAGKIKPQNAALQKYVKDAGPVLEKHLRDAKALQDKMGGSKSK